MGLLSTAYAAKALHRRSPRCCVTALGTGGLLAHKIDRHEQSTGTSRVHGDVRRARTRAQCTGTRAVHGHERSERAQSARADPGAMTKACDRVTTCAGRRGTLQWGTYIFGCTRPESARPQERCIKRGAATRAHNCACAQADARRGVRLYARQRCAQHKLHSFRRVVRAPAATTDARDSLTRGA